MSNYRIETGVELDAMMAERFLGDNKVNRNLKLSNVYYLAKEMLQGNWVHGNGTNLVFDWNGDLRDGQHRCAALVQAQKSEDDKAKKEKRTPERIKIKFDIVRGVDPQLVRTIDIGFKRTLADTLVMEYQQEGGVIKNSAAIAGALRYVLSHERGNIYDNSRITNDNGWEGFKRHKGLIEINEKLQGLNYTVSRSFILALYRIFGMVKAHQHLVHPFFETLATGEDLKKGDPVLTLRNKFFALRANGSIHRNVALCLIIRAWNYYSEGKKLSNMCFTPNNLPKPKARRVGGNLS